MAVIKRKYKMNNKSQITFLYKTLNNNVNLLDMLTQKINGGMSDGSPDDFAFFSLARASCTRSVG